VCLHQTKGKHQSAKVNMWYRYRCSARKSDPTHFEARLDGGAPPWPLAIRDTRSDAHQMSASHVHGVRRGALRRLRIAQHRLPVRPVMVPVRFATLLMQLHSCGDKNFESGQAWQQ